MIIFLYGTHSYRRAKRIKTLTEAFEKKFDGAEHAITHITPEHFDRRTLHTALRSQGLFSQKQFVRIDDVWALPKEAQTILQEELTDTPEETIVCISADAPPRKDNPLFVALKKMADTVEEYGDLDHAGLRTFIQGACTQRGATIDSQSIAMLIARIGNDLWQMEGVINSLAHYTKNISLKETELFVTETLNDNIFDLTDALGSQQMQRALSLLEDHYALGNSPQYIITMLAKHFHTLLLVKIAPDATLPLHPYVLQKATTQTARFSLNRLHALYRTLIKIDATLKTTRIDPRVLLDQCVVSACTAENTA